MAIATHLPSAHRVTVPAPVAHLDRLARGAVVAVAAGLLYLVGHDGAPAWRAVRVAVVSALVLLLLRSLERSAPRWRAVTEVVVGLVAVAVGVGVAGPHLVKTGLSALAVAGVLALGGGLVLSGRGSAALVRSVSRWWRPPVVLGVLVALVVVLYSLGQAVAATNVPRTAVGAATPLSLGFAYEDVELEAADGTMLSGWWIPSENGAAVAVLHGAGSTRSGALDQAAVLAHHGYGVLLYDARGHGRSDGRAMDFGWYGDDDLAGAVAFLQAQPGVDPDRIGAVGFSMGGEQAIGAMAAIPELRAVVAEGATNRVAADKAWEVDEYGWRGVVQQGLNWLTTRVTDLLTDAEAPGSLRKAAAAAAPRPVLMIAGGDMPEEPLAAAHVERGAPGSVDVWVVPGAGHTAGFDTAPDAWTEHVVGFLDEALQVAR